MNNLINNIIEQAKILNQQRKDYTDLYEKIQLDEKQKLDELKKNKLKIIMRIHLCQDMIF